MRPDRMTNREWKALTSDQRAAIEEQQAAARAQQEEQFEMRMRWDTFEDAKLTWLRDRIIALEERVAELEDK